VKRTFCPSRPGIGPLSIASSAAALLLTQVEPCHATVPGGNDSSYVNYEPPPTVRRGGFAMGLSLGLGAGTVSGFPNKVESLSDPRAEVFTGPALAGNLSLWLGGAIRDWFTIGLGFRSTTGVGDDKVASLPAALLHLEGFPLFFKGGAYQHLGLAFDGGLGGGSIFNAQATPGEGALAYGGSMSFVGLTAFYEPLRFWQFSAGPGLSYTHAFSQSLISHDVLLTFRLTFYGNQPRSKTPGDSPKKSDVGGSAPAIRF
jgi:hypothetical protein